MFSREISTAWRGISLAVFAMFFFALTYALYKAAVFLLPNTSVIFFQSLLSLCILIPFVFQKNVSLFDSPKIKFLCLRGLAGLLGMYCLTLALTTESLAATILLNNTYPLIIPLLACFFLREKIQHSAWPYLGLGFLGIALVLHPGTAGLSLGLWLALLSSFFAACVAIITRYTAHEPLPRILFYYFLIICLGTLPFIFFSWKTPSPLAWIYLSLAAVTAVGAQGLCSAALRHLSAQKIAPMSYLIVIFSVLIGWIAWNESLKIFSLLGMILIIFSGVMILLRSPKKASSEALALFEPLSAGIRLKQAAQTLGFHVIGIYAHAKKTYEECGLKEEDYSKHCDTVIFEEDFEKILKKLKAFPHPIKGCIAASELGVEFTEKAASCLGLISNPKDPMNARRDKGQMRKLLMKGGLCCPEFSICSSIQEVKQFALNHSFPLVIKTPKGAASDLVFICRTLEHLLARFEEIIRSKNIFGSHTDQAIVEEYVGGKEYIINTFSDGNQVFVTDVWIYDKIQVGELTALYYNTLFVPLEEASIQPLIAYAKKVTSLFKIEKGPAHLEVKDDPQKGPTLIEIGARLSGGSIPYLIRKYSNFDPFFSNIEIFTKGKAKLEQPISHKKHLAIVHCPVAEGGKTVRVHGIQEIRELPSYDSHKLSFEEGEIIPASSSLVTIPFHVLLAHENRDPILKDVDKVHELFSIEFEEGRRSITPPGDLV